MFSVSLFHDHLFRLSFHFCLSDVPLLAALTKSSGFNVHSSNTSSLAIQDHYFIGSDLSCWCSYDALLWSLVVLAASNFYFSDPTSLFGCSHSYLLYSDSLLYSLTPSVYLDLLSSSSGLSICPCLDVFTSFYGYPSSSYMVWYVLSSS